MADVRTAGQLVAWRESLGWTQRECAEWYGVTERQWQRYESGENALPEPLIRAIARSRHRPHGPTRHPNHPNHPAEPPPEAGEEPPHGLPRPPGTGDPE